MKRMKTVIAIGFILVGVILLSIPLYIEYEQSKQVRALEEALFLIQEADGDEVDLSSVADLSLSKDSLHHVMELEIPAIGLKQKVLNETSEETLAIALTQIKEQQVPGKGNFTIAGHRGYRDGRHFSNLAHVPVGSTVYLHDGGQTYVYEVKRSQVIEPTHVEILEDRPGEAELTMITCTVSGKQRVAVTAEFIEATPSQN